MLQDALKIDHVIAAIGAKRQPKTGQAVPHGRRIHLEVFRPSTVDADRVVKMSLFSKGLGVEPRDVLSRSQQVDFHKMNRLG
jgi:hypothetical protein